MENFPISGWTLPPALIHALGLVKYACGVANRDLGKLTGSGKNPLSDQQVEALLQACREVAEGQLDDQFPVDVFQTGSGTSSNMNVNEVIANRAIEIAGRRPFPAGEADPSQRPREHGAEHERHVPHGHPRGRRGGIQARPDPGPAAAARQLALKASEWDAIIKIGRTHLMDATPLRLGQEFGGFARQIDLSVQRAAQAIDAVLELPVGRHGGRVGDQHASGIRPARQPGAGRRDASSRSSEAANHFEANAAARRAGRMPRPTADDRRHAVQCRQQHSLAGLRPALRLLRGPACRAASRAARSCPARSTR